MKTKELRQKSDVELGKILEEERARIHTLRFSGVSGKVKDVKEMARTRRTIARVITLLKEKEATIH